MNALGVVLAGGSIQLAGAVLTVLSDIATGIGALVMLCTVILAAVVAHELRAGKREHAATQPSRVIEPGDDAIDEFGHDLDKEIDDMLRKYKRNG